MSKYKDRLVEEWDRHGKVIIAVDYDDTIRPWKLATQSDCSKVIKELKYSKNAGAYISIFTACNEDRYDEIRDYCSSLGLQIDSINTNPIELPYGNTNKIYANIFLDDRAGLDESLKILREAREEHMTNSGQYLKDGDTEF